MFQELLKKPANELKAKEIPYMIISGQAVLLYGEPRLTKDIGDTLGLGIEGLSIIKELEKSLTQGQDKEVQNEKNNCFFAFCIYCFYY